MNITLPLLLLYALSGGTLMNVDRLPWLENETNIVVADFDGDGRGEVGLLSRTRIEVYERGDRDPTYAAVLPEHTVAVDVADLDTDGVMDVVVVAGDDIYTITMAPDGAIGTAKQWFTRENQYAHYRGVPFPTVLVIHRDSTPLIALPCDDALELRQLDGELVEEVPTGMDAPGQPALGHPFNAWINQHAQAGGADALEIRVSSLATFKPLMPVDTIPVAAGDPAGRRGTPRQQVEAATRTPDHWPWFPVSSTDSATVRALYARGDLPSGQTIIRIRRSATGSAGNGGPDIGPPRHYPGFLLNTGGAIPDFNGDGHADLLLWKARQMMPTVDSLAHAAMRGTWPIRVSAHLYNPGGKRFEARPAGQIQMEIPVARYLDTGAMAPLTPLFLHDVNGDGHTDLGTMTEPDTVAIWPWTDGGFPTRPGFRRTFDSPVKAVVLEADLEGDGQTTIGLRTRTALYLLRPTR